jgi:hypothetical protein
LKTFLEEIVWEKAERYMRGYFSMPEKYFLTNRHDIPTFNLSSSRNKILHFLETGKLVTHSEIHKLDQEVHKKQEDDNFVALMLEERRKREEKEAIQLEARNAQ